ncbi:TRAP transporter substrate-binding protein DctP [Inquilinus limosus]|uniref:C4-dicarboxylate ABC transporter n=1 Tax=Inquilinus limosus TaxID=171674 RepID=A0A211ZF18_9PROT|nr:TRAP transporter substrate-binding protein DctP [Inquilinus limosus]OWJ63754.1 C4-dicarboxylate ABC transporter [Inquilinus limosus]
MLRIAVAAAAIGLLWGWPVWAGDYKSEYKLSVVLGKPVSFGVIAEDWANAVRERTAGRINIQVYPNAMLVGGDQTREFSALREGVIDMALGAGISWSPQVKEFNVFSLPFLISSNEAADAVVSGPAGDYVFDRLRRLGVEPLAWGDSGFRIIANSRHPIRAPEDLKGLKIRAVGSPLFTDLYAALGANPTQMSTADMQPALATGAVDGADQSVEGFNLLKLVTLRQKYLTLLNYCWEPVVFAVNKEVWDSWTPADQEVVRATAVELGSRMRELKRKGLTQQDDSLLKEIEASGVDVAILTSEERQRFRDATRPIFDKWAAKLDPRLVEMVETSAGYTGN